MRIPVFFRLGRDRCSMLVRDCQGPHSLHSACGAAVGHPSWRPSMSKKETEVPMRRRHGRVLYCMIAIAIGLTGCQFARPGEIGYVPEIIEEEEEAYRSWNRLMRMRAKIEGEIEKITKLNYVRLPYFGEFYMIREKDIFFNPNGLYGLWLAMARPGPVGEEARRLWQLLTLLVQRHGYRMSWGDSLALYDGYRGDLPQVLREIHRLFVLTEAGKLAPPYRDLLRRLLPDWKKFLAALPESQRNFIRYRYRLETPGGEIETPPSRDLGIDDALQYIERLRRLERGIGTEEDLEWIRQFHRRWAEENRRRMEGVRRRAVERTYRWWGGTGMRPAPVPYADDRDDERSRRTPIQFRDFLRSGTAGIPVTGIPRVRRNLDPRPGDAVSAGTHLIRNRRMPRPQARRATAASRRTGTSSLSSIYLGTICQKCASSRSKSRRMRSARGLRVSRKCSSISTRSSRA